MTQDLMNVEEIVESTQLAKLSTTEMRRFKAVAQSYIDDCQVRVAVPPTNEQAATALCLSASGASWEEVMAELGWSQNYAGQVCTRFKEGQILKDGCHLLFKAFLDTQLSKAVTKEVAIDITSLKTQMRHNSSYYNDDLLNAAEFVTLNSQERVCKIVNLMGRGEISINQMSRLLDSMLKLDELSLIPALEEKLQIMQDEQG